MPGLIRGVARVAAVSGTATVVSNRVSRRQAQRWQQQEAEQAPVQPAPAAPPAGGDSAVEQLKDLAELKNQGVLTDDEFATQKAKILAQ
jgi:Short C-terminal domain